VTSSQEANDLKALAERKGDRELEPKERAEILEQLKRVMAAWLLSQAGQPGRSAEVFLQRLAECHSLARSVIDALNKVK
jgi:hypothetical protein